MPSDTTGSNLGDDGAPRGAVADPDVQLGDPNALLSRSQPNNKPRLRLQVPEDGEATRSPGESAVNLDAGVVGSGRTPENIEKLDGLSKSARFSFQIPKSHTSRLSLSKCFAKLKTVFPGLNPSWVSNNFDATHVKPAIRAAVAAWISLILMVVPKTERAMGQASFLILVAGFLSPPTDPFTAVVERELAILFFVTVSFAWSALGIRLSNLARENINTQVSQTEIFSGRFIEAGPAVICAVFLFIGTSLLLYVRARVGPGPYLIPMILSCILLDISLTVAPMFPYPTYIIGKSVLIPITFHSAVAIACSVLVFPETINAQFIKRFQGVFRPLSKAIGTQPDLLGSSPMSDDFDPKPFSQYIASAEAALAPLAATSRLMKKDVSWGRFGSKDFSRLHDLARRMVVRANGMAFYFKIIDPVVDKQPGTPALSRFTSPASTAMQSRASSRPPSPNQHLGDEAIHSSNTSVSLSTRRRHRPKHSLLHYSFHHNHHHHHRHLPASFIMHIQHPSSLFHEIVERSAENPVGVFESQRYLNLETRLSHPSSAEYITLIMSLLKESAEELLVCNETALKHVASWLERMNQERFFKIFMRKRTLSWEDAVKKHEDMKAQLQQSLDDFRDKKRHRVLDMYRDSLSPNRQDDPDADEPPPHRYLFQSYLYQYHLIIFTSHLLAMLDEMINLEKSRRRSRLWLPILPWRKIFIWSKWEPTDAVIGHNEDEDPDIIPGIDPDSRNEEDLGQPRRRDPDALPPSNALEAFGTLFYSSVGALGHGNAIFGFKAGILTLLLSLPNFFKSSAEFAYANRSVWAIVIGQLTISRFRGDTAFGWFSRVTATFLGGLIGTAMWYISTGDGKGNPFGLAAVTAVCFPTFFFARLYFPASPMTLTIFFVTTVLVVGYSWQDTHIPTPSTAGWGISVAWKRFVLVTIGVTVAFILSFFPPSTTLRRYLRTTYATTAEQIGQLYCDIVSYAAAPSASDSENISRGLIAVRLKLKRNLVLKQNVSYEFSLRGKWPTSRYTTVHEIQMEIAYLLSHLRSVTEHLELPWAKAFLRRTRFLEPDFQGDVLAVISLISTSLRTGTPLPQVTPCPLLDRFTAHHHGLNIVRDEQDDNYGLPRSLTIETLEDEQYMYFSVGVSTAYGIVSRLDRLMIATKALVGEQYHINGLPLYVSKRN